MLKYYCKNNVNIKNNHSKLKEQVPVSYTHLDVYKRQALMRSMDVSGILTGYKYRQSAALSSV